MLTLTLERPMSLPNFTFPTFENILGGLPFEPWLKEEYTTLANSPSLIDQFAAVGMIGRLWALPRGGKRRTMSELLGLVFPATRAQAWLATQDRAAVAAVVGIAIAEAGNLASEIERLERELPTDEDAILDVACWAWDREVIGCFVALFAETEHAEVLQQALARLDARAQDCTNIAWDHLPTVSHRDAMMEAAILPDRWWAQHALPALPGDLKEFPQ